MKNKLLSNLLLSSLVTVGITTGANSAQASYLAPGTLEVRTNTGVFFSNNIVDFSGPGTVKGLGSPGFGITTTPANPLTNAGVFGIVEDGSNGTISEASVITKLAGRSFVTPGPGATVPAGVNNVQFNDLFVDPAIFPTTSTDGNVQTTIFTLTELGGTPFAFLQFDTDGDGLYGEVAGAGTNPLGDFKYFGDKVTRRVTNNGAGGFDISFDIEGFFQDMEGNFRDTRSVVSIFNGTSSVNPNNLALLTVAEYDAIPGTSPGQVSFVATVDGTITTEHSIPEPSSMVGLLAVAGLGLGSRLKRKSK